MNQQDAFLNSAGSYLKRYQRKDGRFSYRARPDGGEVKRDYNTLRHAGTVYALCNAKPFLSLDVSFEIERALEYLWRWFLVPVPGSEMQFAIASGRKGQLGADIAKLGGLGLSLVALCSVDRPWTAFETTAAEGMMRYTRTLIRDDGSMIFKLNYRSGKAHSFQSLYYPGEVALGFLMYGVRQGDAAAVDACKRILLRLADARRGLDTVPADHWALLATARLFSEARTGSIDLDENTEVLLYHHGAQVIEEILAAADLSKGPTGALVDTGKCCSIATRLEGLTAMQPWLMENEYPSLQIVNQRIEDGVGYLLRSQYKDGDCIGGLPWVPDFHPASSGRANSPEVRVDTVQHAISAVLGAKAISPETKPSTQKSKLKGGTLSP